MKTNIEIPVADLKTVLPGLSKIVSKKTSLPVLSCVKVTLGADRNLRIQANNLEQIVTARFNKPFNGNPGELLVPLDELTGMAKHCSAEDTIELSVDGKETSISYPAAGTRIRKPLTYMAPDAHIATRTKSLGRSSKPNPSPKRLNARIAASSGRTFTPSLTFNQSKTYYYESHY